MRTSKAKLKYTCKQQLQQMHTSRVTCASPKGWLIPTQKMSALLIPDPSALCYPAQYILHSKPICTSIPFFTTLPKPYERNSALKFTAFTP